MVREAFETGAQHACDVTDTELGNAGKSVCNLDSNLQTYYDENSHPKREHAIYVKRVGHQCHEYAPSILKPTSTGCLGSSPSVT
eukprot:scaffold353531_cov22-Prasinocladus_malaysianus.AAC.1